MSGTHSHTAAAQADVQRADVQARKPNVPPGHVEADRPVRRLGNRQVGMVFAGAAGLVVVVAAAALLIG